jgi:hypothetical protein
VDCADQTAPLRWANGALGALVSGGGGAPYKIEYRGWLERGELSLQDLCAEADPRAQRQLRAALQRFYRHGAAPLTVRAMPWPRRGSAWAAAPREPARLRLMKP